MRGHLSLKHTLVAQRNEWEEFQQVSYGHTLITVSFGSYKDQPNRLIKEPLKDRNVKSARVPGSGRSECQHRVGRRDSNQNATILSRPAHFTAPVVIPAMK